MTKLVIPIDQYLKVKEFGLIVGHETKAVQKMLVAIDWPAQHVFQCVRFNRKNSPMPVYAKTYDMIKVARPGKRPYKKTWADYLKYVQRISPSSVPFFGMDLRMHEVIVTKKPEGGYDLKTGRVLGHSTTHFNRENLRKFVEEIKKLGVEDRILLVGLSVEVMHTPIPRGGYSWGNLKYELKGVLN